jgi:hypothetical protein
MQIRKDRDYHIRHSGNGENRKPDTPRRSHGGALCSCDSPCGLEAIHPVFAHLSTRPFGPVGRSRLRPCCGMTAEFTENPTLFRAYARGDSPWSFTRRSFIASLGPDICFVAYATGCCSVGYASHGVCHMCALSEAHHNALIYNEIHGSTGRRRDPADKPVLVIRQITFTERLHYFPKKLFCNRLYTRKLFLTTGKDTLHCVRPA